MSTIKYSFADGHTDEIEVSEDFAMFYGQLEKDEKRLERKETRRHISLESLEENGIHLEARNSDPLEILIQKEQQIEKPVLLSSLTSKQKKTLIKYALDGKSKSEIASELNIDESAVRQRLKAAFRSIKVNVKYLCRKNISGLFL